MLIKVGITGGIGSGKSVVSRLLEIMGIPVYISDTEAKRICDSSFADTANAVERYQEKTGAMGHRMVASTDEQIERLVGDVTDEFDAEDEIGDVQPMEPDEIIEAVRNGEAREILAAANETMAAQLKEETDKLLDSVLYTASMNMKNGFHMSDF